MHQNLLIEFEHDGFTPNTLFSRRKIKLFLDEIIKRNSGGTLHSFS